MLLSQSRARRPLHERWRALQGIVPKGSIVSEALSVEEGSTRRFATMPSRSLAHIKSNSSLRVKWHKIKNCDYTEKEGRGDLFNGPRNSSSTLQ